MVEAPSSNLGSSTNIKKIYNKIIKHDYQESNMRRTRIIGTIGPASDNIDTLEALVAAGLNIARLNYSHGNLEQKTELIQKLRQVEKKSGKPIGILADLPGPKLRLGSFPEEISLGKNNIVHLHCGYEELENEIKIMDNNGQTNEYNIPVRYAGLSEDLNESDAILIADGTVRLKVIKSPKLKNSVVTCEVIEPGKISSRKGVNVPGTLVSLPSVGEKDLASIKHALENGIDFIAVSYVRNVDDLIPAINAIKEAGKFTPIIAKIEHPAAINNFEDILNNCSGVMVARGDLGVEIPYEEVPLIQEKLISKTLERGLPVIVATQVLESMTNSPVPTRAEVTDIANAIRQGTSALMLSGETASGKYPLEAVRTMSKVCAHVEQGLDTLHSPPALSKYKATRAVAHAGVALSNEENVSRLLVASENGNAARLVSAYRPNCPITVLTNKIETMRKNTILWGVESILVQEEERSRLTILKAIEQLLIHEKIKPNDRLVSVSGSPRAITGATNTVRFFKLDNNGELIKD
ncbi:MAG: pyruvate kinase [Methanobacteriota archaeon]|nr:MAG: pyruvate kinase [Euryarchaeota archaeon]